MPTGENLKDAEVGEKKKKKKKGTAGRVDLTKDRHQMNLLDVVIEIEEIDRLS